MSGSSHTLVGVLALGVLSCSTSSSVLDAGTNGGTGLDSGPCGRPAPTQHLWIAWDPSAAPCASHVTSFFRCVLDQTSFNQLALTYLGARPLSLGGTAQLNTACSDIQCVENQARFPVTSWDVIAYFQAANQVTSYNSQEQVSVGTTSAPVSVGWVRAGADCDLQTCLGSHEVYEAASWTLAADCCNGQTNCVANGQSQCDPSCGQYAATSGCYPLTCSGVTYSMELLGVAPWSLDGGGSVLSPAGCMPVTFCDGG